MTKGRVKKAVLGLVLVCAMVLGMVQTSFAMNGPAEEDPVIAREDPVISGKAAVISRFERPSPVYWEFVEPGTALKDTGLPTTVRAVFDLETFEITADDFEQARPGTDPADGSASDDFYYYGYLAEDPEEKYAADERVVYHVFITDPVSEDETYTTEYRVYGSAGTVEDAWFTCDAEGVIDGVILDVPVTWSGEYDGETDGAYVFEGNVEDYAYEGEAPTAEIIVSSELYNDSESEEDAEFGEEKEPEEEAETGEEEETEEAYEIVPFSSAATRSSDSDMESAVNQAISSSGGKLSNTSGTASSWGMYVNSIFWYKGWEEFAWTPHEALRTDLAAWTGVSANRNGNPATEPTAYPTFDGKTYLVYSGEQLQYALETIHAWTGDYVIELACDIDLNGQSWYWTGGSTGNTGIALQRGCNLTINGNGFGIYNMCQYNGYGFFADYYNLTMNDVTFYTAKMVTNQQYSGVIGQTSENSGNGGTPTYTRHFDNVDVSDCLIACTNTTTTAAGSDGDCYISPFTAWSRNVYRIEYTGTPAADVRAHSVNNCSVNDCYVYGCNHVNGFSCGASQSEVTNCFSQGNLICGTGYHSAGFVSCNVIYSDFDSCFTANDFYGTTDVSGFISLSGNCTLTNCYSTGKVEGYRRVGGFCVSCSNGNEYGVNTTTDCYSTALVSLRNDGTYLGGFYAESSFVAKGTDETTRDPLTTTTAYHMTNCYAAGEVGNTNTDMSGPVNIGGFISSYGGMQREDNGHNYADGKRLDAFSYCYYDKQTTAMRGWLAGDVNTEMYSGSSVSNSLGKDAEGNSDSIIGVLTTETDKEGSGLADGTLPTHFSGNTWIARTNYYPQLAVFANAGAGTWGSEKAALVQAYSLASVSTVLLDTWDTGYDWDAYGIRSTGDELSYNRSYTSDFKGNQYTYDTVRDIISDFTATGDGNMYTYMIVNGTDGKGAYSEIVQQTVYDQHVPGVGDQSGTYTGSVEIRNGDGSLYSGDINEPGVEWYRIARTTGGQTGWRPIRLIAYMHINAGDDRIYDEGDQQKLKNGDLYDHRDDVKLTVMNSLPENLVVGWQDNVAWSKALTGGYPATDDYYEVAVGPQRNSTTYSYAGATRLWTEIWTAKPWTGEISADSGGSTKKYTDEKGNEWQEYYSIEVTGKDAQTSDLEERTWNGYEPHLVTSDGSASSTYIVSYYWMLDDGRYVNDYKIIILEAKHDVTIQVKNYYDVADGSMENSFNSEALQIGAGIAAYEDESKGTPYALSASASSYESTKENHNDSKDIDSGTNVTFGWKRAETGKNYILKKIQIDYEPEKTNSGGTAVIELAGKNILDLLEMGQTDVDIDVAFETVIYKRYDGTAADAGQKDDEFLDRDYRETLADVEVTLTYTIYYDKDEGLYTLTLNKFSNYLKDPTDHDDPDGIQIKSVNGIAYADSVVMTDEQFCDVTVTLWVAEGTDLDLVKFRDNDLTDASYTTSADGEKILTDETIAGFDKLAGATFALYKEEDVNTVADPPAPKAEAEPVCIYETDENGWLQFTRLEEEATYYIFETKPPKGYNLLSPGYWTVTVHKVTSGDGDTTWIFNIGGGEHYLGNYTDDDGTRLAVYIGNTQIDTLPNTGGEGAWLFLMLGVMVAGGSLIIVRRRRRS